MSSELGTTGVAAHDLDRAFDLTLAGRCIPAGHAGQPIAGDFYDTFVLDDHRSLIVVGDVAGHGLGAGSRMRHLRATVRSAARWTSGPSELLRLLDANYALGDKDDIATVWIGIYDRDTSLLHYASAGHPPPVIAEIGGRTDLLAVASAPPLGTGVVAAHAQTHAIRWPAGALLVVYSDGLVERPGHNLDDQISQLSRHVASLASHTQAANPRVLAGRLLHAVVQNQASPLDDMCILVLRRDTDAVAPRGATAPALSTAHAVASGLVR